MNYKQDTLLSIVRFLMQPNGATVKKLAIELGMTHRSILRWLDRVLVQYPNLEGRYLNGSREKHWRIPICGNAVPELTTVSAHEVDVLERYAKINELQNRHGEAAAIRSVLARNEISGFSPVGTKISDYEYFIPRQFYIEQIDNDVMRIVFEALRDDCYLKLDEYVKANGEVVFREIIPLILLTDLNRYVVGFEKEKCGEPKSFLLTRVKKASLGTPIKKADFHRKMNFVPDLYIRNSFSIYHGEKEMYVKLRFSGRAAFPASQFHFQNSQIVKRLKNGETQVEFNARGVDAICNHLFTWGENVRVLSPKSLQNSYKEKLKKVLSVIG